MKVQFTETVLRDANQSLIATRLPYETFAPILKDDGSGGVLFGGVLGRRDI